MKIYIVKVDKECSEVSKEELREIIDKEFGVYSEVFETNEVSILINNKKI